MKPTYRICRPFNVEKNSLNQKVGPNFVFFSAVSPKHTLRATCKQFTEFPDEQVNSVFGWESWVKFRERRESVRMERQKKGYVEPLVFSLSRYTHSLAFLSLAEISLTWGWEGEGRSCASPSVSPLQVVYKFAGVNREVTRILARSTKFSWSSLKFSVNYHPH